MKHNNVFLVCTNRTYVSGIPRTDYIVRVSHLFLQFLQFLQVQCERFVYVKHYDCATTVRVRQHYDPYVTKVLQTVYRALFMYPAATYSSSRWT